MRLELETVTVTLDGCEVEGSQDMTILELARESGMQIPTLCDHSALGPYGACRVCLVEDEKTERLVASCVTTIHQGMVINTKSPRALQHRKMIVRLLLASHPTSCAVCDKGNRCDLRRIASDLGIGLTGMYSIPQPGLVEDLNPFIERNPSKCILCGKCIRICRELVVEGALDYLGRGFGVTANTFGKTPLEESECTFCGACVAACPTGALMEKDRVYGGTTRQVVETVCPYCACGCEIRVEVKDGRLVRATPKDEGKPLCVRGSYGLDFVHSSDRLQRPHARRNGKLEETTWDQALGTAADRLREIRDEHGPDSIAVLGSSKATNEDNYLLQRFTRCVIGTNNIDNGSRLYNPATRVGLGDTVGLTGTTNYLENLNGSDVIIVVGADLANSAPQVGYAVRRAALQEETQLIVIDPAKTKLTQFSDMWLQPALGTDILLLIAMAQVICEEDLWDREFVSRKTDGFEDFSSAIRKWSPEWAESMTGISAGKIRSAARAYANAPKAAIVYGSGITQQRRPAESVRALASLAMLTGNVWRPGGGLYAIGRDSNGQGACDLGALPDLLPGYHNIEHRGSRAGFEEAWETDLPEKPGLSALQMLHAAKEGKVRALYVVGENPMQNYPDPAWVTEALSNLDLLIVQDMFLNETAEQADIVLPAASFAEKEGTMTNFEGRINSLKRVIRPLGESLPDWEIVLRLAEKMEQPLPFSSLGDIRAEIMDLLPEIGPLDQPHAKDVSSQPPHAHRWPASRGMAHFRLPKISPVPDAPREYPYTLVITNTLWGQGSGARTGRAPRLQRFAGEIYVEMSEFDAQVLGIESGDKVVLISPVGKVTARVRLNHTLPDGVLALPGHFRQQPTTALFNTSIDPDTGTPMLKSCHVRLERMESHGR